jgi:hypothetical protein
VCSIGETGRLGARRFLTEGNFYQETVNSFRGKLLMLVLATFKNASKNAI